MRIASLLPSATELCCSLGLRDQLVAISHECDHPSGLDDLPRITGSIIPHGLEQKEIDSIVRKAVSEGRSLYTIDDEMLNSLAPDLIVTQGLCSVCAVSESTIEASLRGTVCQLSADTQVLSLNGMSFTGICEDLLAIANATNQEDMAQKRIREATRCWQQLQQGNGERVLLLEWVDPYFSAGHWVPEQIEAIGCTSAIGSPKDHSRTLSLEEVVQSKAEYIGIICCGFGLEKNIQFAQQLMTDDRYTNIPAVQSKQVWAFDANSFFSRPTLRIVDGAMLLQEAFLHQREISGSSHRCSRSPVEIA